MRLYGKIESGFWQNAKVRRLTERGKLALLYLLSCPHGNAAGCFTLPKPYAAHDLGWSLETVNAIIRELSVNGFVRVDDTNDVILIVGWWGHNGIENPNVAKSVGAAVKPLPNCALKREAIERLSGLKHVSETLVAALLEGLPERFEEALQKPSPNIEPNLTELEPIRTEPDAPAGDAPNGAPVENGQTEMPLGLVRPPNGDWSIALFRQGLAWLSRVSGKPPDKLRGILGKWLKSAGNDHRRVFDLLAHAERTAIAEPVAWITANLGDRPPATPASSWVAPGLG